MMKQAIKEEEIRQFDRVGKIFAVLMVSMLVTPIPLALWFGLPGLAGWAVLAAVTIVYSFKVERFKKEHDIQTYKEIVAFTQGRRLDELEAQQEMGKRMYQKVLLFLGSGLLGLITCELLWLLLK